MSKQTEKTTKKKKRSKKNKNKNKRKKSDKLAMKILFLQKKNPKTHFTYFFLLISLSVIFVIKIFVGHCRQNIEKNKSQINKSKKDLKR